ncbi:MAG: hypothetical protein AB1631_29480 [Acidobacteriota bacterium]
MSRGEFLTRLTVWIALAGYFAGVILLNLSRDRRRWEPMARLAWTAGCLSLLAHLAFAFHVYHDWSHDAAYRETARQTSEVTGFDWGGGLYINYALVGGWVIDVLWWWRGLDSYRRRPFLVTAVWHGFLIFIIFNATAVFKTGPLRWIGVGMCAAILLLWLRSFIIGSKERMPRDKRHGFNEQ